ncbi:hypothetical protein PG996_013324 [Apiospora saccharicola]|uniref:Uncharacterized protein n=1 Tax=Apiospora saccharicola TaxID=335842 RepID=A0ABR1U594_9PEZI
MRLRVLQSRPTFLAQDRASGPAKPATSRAEDVRNAVHHDPGSRRVTGHGLGGPLVVEDDRVLFAATSHAEPVRHIVPASRFVAGHHVVVKVGAALEAGADGTGEEVLFHDEEVEGLGREEVRAVEGVPKGGALLRVAEGGRVAHLLLVALLGALLAVVVADGAALDEGAGHGDGGEDGVSEVNHVYERDGMVSGLECSKM